MDKMKENRLKWFIRTVMDLSVEGRRGRGRPKKKLFNAMSVI